MGPSTVLAFARLSRTEKLLAVRALIKLHYYYLAVRRRPFSVLHEQVRAAHKSPPSGLPPEKIVELVQRCSEQFCWTNNCLVRSLCNLELLLNSGIEVSLRLGAQAAESSPGDVHPVGFTAHAWIEDAKGSVLGDKPGHIESFKQLKS